MMHESQPAAHAVIMSHIDHSHLTAFTAHTQQSISGLYLQSPYKDTFYKSSIHSTETVTEVVSHRTVFYSRQEQIQVALNNYCATLPVTGRTRQAHCTFSLPSVCLSVCCNTGTHRNDEYDATSFCWEKMLWAGFPLSFLYYISVSYTHLTLPTNREV